MKPKIFLADLVHNQHTYPYAVPLNIGKLAANLSLKFNKRIDIKLFKFADKLLDNLSAKPDILALSNYDWNVNLTRTIARMAKKMNPDVFIVMGGPNIDGGNDLRIKNFLTNNPYVDAYILFDGEEPIVNLVEHFMGHEGLLQDSMINKEVSLDQIAYLNSEGELIKGGICPSMYLKDIPYPSAYLSGYMDEFLDSKDFPLFPIFETTRGCPYKCSFCSAWGTAVTGIKTIRKFDLDTVFEELEYFKLD